MLSFGEAVRRFYGNYTNADGRAQRSAFWWVQLYQLIIAMVLSIVILMADGGLEYIESVVEALSTGEFTTSWADLGWSGEAAIYSIFIFGFANFIPNIMLNIRRFHDLNQSGWFVLAFFIFGAIPNVGLIADLVKIIWFINPGTTGPNQYGPDPLGHDTDIFG